MTDADRYELYIIILFKMATKQFLGVGGTPPIHSRARAHNRIPTPPILATRQLHSFTLTFRTVLPTSRPLRHKRKRVSDHIYLFIYLFTYLLIHLFTYLFTYLFIYSFIHSFIHSFIYLFIYLSIYLFIYLFIYLSIYSFLTFISFRRNITTMSDSIGTESVQPCFKKSC